MKVAIIGGGFAGLGVAYELIEEGVIPTVFERSSSLGGLASSFSVSGVPLEHFYHHMFPTYHDFFEVADKLAFKDQIYFVKAKSANLYHGKLFPFSTVADLLRFTPLSFINRLRTGAVIAYLKLKRSPDSFEKLTAHDWMQKAFGKQAYSVLWQPLLDSKFGSRANDIGMVWMWGRIFERPNRFGYFKGGFKTIVDALYTYLIAESCVINLNSEIISLTRDGAQFVVKTKDKEDRFDRVIVAAPPASFMKIAGEILPADFKDGLGKYGYVGSICAIMTLKKSLSPFYWISVDEPESPFVAVVEQTRFVPKDTYGGAVPVYLSRYVALSDPLYQLSEEELWKKFLPYVSKINPAFDESWIIEKHLFKAPFTQPIVSSGYKKIKPVYETPIPNLFWISMSHIYPWDRGTDHSFHAGRQLVRKFLHKKRHA